MFDKQQIDDLSKVAGEKLKMSPDQIKKAVNSESVDKILKNLKPGDAQRLQNLLSDKEATERLLSTPQAQALMKKLIEGKL